MMPDRYSGMTLISRLTFFLLFPLLAWFLGGCMPFSAQVPEGFASSSEGKSLLIYSPDGLKAEIKTEKNYPRKDTAFWAEALKTQLEGEGYLLADEKPFSSINLEGICFTWLLPLGHEYYKYMTAISVKGGKIYIMEAAGEKGLFDSYKTETEKILSSVSAR